MTAAPGEEYPGQAAAPESAPSAEGRAQPNPVAPRFAPWAIWLAGVLVLVVATVALSPFWAPAMAPLLPWRGTSSVQPAEYEALSARIGAVEKRPVLPNGDVEAIKSAEAALARRVERLEAAGNSGDAAAAVTAMQTMLQHLGQRLAATDAQAASAAADAQKMQQELIRLDKISADLAVRLAAFENRAQAQGRADRTNLSLLLALMQLRQAVETTQPFAAEYDTFAALARDRPELVAAAGPLAATARSGVAGDAMLKLRLAELADPVARPASPPAADWWTQTLVRLRSLVTIRRIDNAGQTGPEAAIGVAQDALEHGELPKAIAALGALRGGDAQAATPWLRSARQRAAAEAALARLQQLLAAGIAGAPRAVPADPPAEAPSKSEAPAKTETPS